MPAIRGRVPAIVAVSLVGTLLGSLVGFGLGRAILLRSAKSGLAAYAQNLTRHADELSGELNQAFSGLDSVPYPFCSDRELAALRALTFRSRNLKDIGRTHNGVLYCSATLGRLADPHRHPGPDITLADGTRVYTNIPLVLAYASGDRGTVLESRDLDVVLSPEAFDHWNRLGVGYLIAVTNRATGEFVPIAGSNWFPDPEWNIADGFRTSSGVLYRSQCSRVNPICVSAAERLSDIWGSSRATEAVSATMGGLAGFGLGFALILLYLRTGGLRYQLRRALRTNSSSLRTVYEPILDVASGRCVGAEVLMRWTGQDGHPISPDVFVRMAEESGFVNKLTAWVVGRATQELGPLLREHPGFTLSINVAAADLNGDALFKILDRHVCLAGIDPCQIALELTERSTADLERTRRSIASLAKLGFKVHIDDFGTGFSNLSYLNQLAVQAIKVDRCFTRTIGTDALTVSILPQMLAMAESLHLDVVVEGVETEAQLEYLKSMQMPLRAQGWYFSRPMSDKELLVFLEENNHMASLGFVRQIAPPVPSTVGIPNRIPFLPFA